MKSSNGVVQKPKDTAEKRPAGELANARRANTGSQKAKNKLRSGKAGSARREKPGFYGASISETEHSDLRAMPSSGLDEEIAMLRVMMRRVLELARRLEHLPAQDENLTPAVALEQATRVLAALSTGAMRLGRLLQVQRELGRGASETAEAIAQALQEVAAEIKAR